MDLDGNVPGPLACPVGEVEVLGTDVQHVPEVKVGLAAVFKLQDFLGRLGVVVREERTQFCQLGRQAVLVLVRSNRYVQLQCAPGNKNRITICKMYN